jgi:hypothetical protein
MLKIFISQPMNGLSADEIMAKRGDIIATINNIFKDDFEIIDSYFADYNPNNGCIPLKYLSKSLELLADADMAYFAKGWETARGCKIEHDVAVAYGIPTITG